MTLLSVSVVDIEPWVVTAVTSQATMPITKPPVTPNTAPALFSRVQHIRRQLGRHFRGANSHEVEEKIEVETDVSKGSVDTS